ncbi:MAG: ribonuclease VapC [Sphingomonadales bacterium]|nr:ribonuclease VapC [Sphingomonadales bacterium]
MIVDTSALVAVAQGEPGSERLKDAIGDGGLIPAPVIVEYRRVISRGGAREAPASEAILAKLLVRLAVEPFTADDADIAAAANRAYGAGNGRGGTLNLLDLMVYATAKRMGLPILCTGRDFASTDALIHPASRTG